ncbi:MAG TPA: hypothetical protein VEH04_16005 [Verrucomicrobiae bacterium]|nr:hypothetical protein [Verrucomicrobiae bacterium]
MKRILTLLLLCAANVHAQYVANWSEFDSGRAHYQGGNISGTGVFSGWLRKPMSSASYGNQQGYPSLPMPAGTAGIPLLTITLAGSNARVAWPLWAANFSLEESVVVGTGVFWTNVPGPYQMDATQFFMVVPATQDGRFYRLTAPVAP